MIDAAANPLLLLAVVLVAGSAFGALAKLIRLPSVTGQILVGIVIGPAMAGLVAREDIHHLQPLIDFALGLMAVSVGSHLVFPRLQVAFRRLLYLLLFEVSVTPILVFSGVRFLSNESWQLILLLAAISVSTAPATILALVKEARAKGVFVKTLVVAVALNNLACILLFELAHAIARASLMEEKGYAFAEAVIEPAKEVLYGILLGCGIGLLLIGVTRRVVRTDRLTALSMMSILLTVGLADALHVSVLLSCLFLGVTLANLTPDKEEIGHKVFDNFEYAIFSVFFTVAGMELDFAYLVPGGLLALVTFILRCSGKITAAWLGMKLAHATARVRLWLGPALVPQAGLAVGLVLLVSEDPVFGEMRSLFLAVVLTSVLLAEIVGPILTKLAITKSGDGGKDRPRVLDFLAEECITTDLQGPTKEAAIRQLLDLALSAGRVSLDREDLVTRILARESEASTCLGMGLALPHARIAEGDVLIGAMGINHDGFDWATPDDRPIHCVVLLLTPRNMPERHLEVLSSLVGIVGGDRAIRQQLFHAKTPAHVYELLHVNEDAEDFNAYLDE